MCAVPPSHSTNTETEALDWQTVHRQWFSLCWFFILWLSLVPYFVLWWYSAWLWMSLCVFPPTCFYALFQFAERKKRNGNARNLKKTTSKYNNLGWGGKLACRWKQQAIKCNESRCCTLWRTWWICWKEEKWRLIKPTDLWSVQESNLPQMNMWNKHF